MVNKRNSIVEFFGTKDSSVGLSHVNLIFAAPLDYNQARFEVAGGGG